MDVMTHKRTWAAYHEAGHVVRTVAWLETAKQSYAKTKRKRRE